MTEKPDDPLTVKFEKVGEWWTATAKTPDGTVVGSGPTRELASDDLDWILMRRSQNKMDPSG